jgi:hypothetical protein
MGLLDKTNPAATPQSAFRVGVIFGLISATGYLIACLSYPAARENFYWMFPCLTILGALLGALMEWQDIDGVDISDVVWRTEREFGIKITDDAAANIESVGDLYDAIITAVSAQRPDAIADDSAKADVWKRLKTLVVHALGVDEDEVVSSARFHYELR